VSVAEIIEAKAGEQGEIQCTFDGEALEITGYTASVLHIPVAEVNIKRKKKPEKNGSQIIYFVTRLLTSRVEPEFTPTEVPHMEKLVVALLDAGAKTI
jgi:hypothetical protein